MRRRPHDLNDLTAVRGRRLLVPAVLVAAVVLALAGVLLAGPPRPDRPVGVLSGPPSTQAVAVVTETEPIVPPLPTLPPASQTASEGRSEVVISHDQGVKVVNSGSSVASTGGNTSVGPGSATVVTGPVTAVGNSSEVRVHRP